MIAASSNHDPGPAQLQLIQALNCAALVVDKRGTVRGTNASAECLLGSDLRVRDNRLQAADRISNDLLKDLIRTAFMGGVLSNQMLPPILIRRASGRPLIIQALPVSAVADATLLLLYDLDAPPHLREERVALLFGLTRAEARLAVRIAGGASLEDVAQISGISPGTARNQLKAVFAKTGTKRQAELVALLWRVSRMADGGS